MRIHFQVLAYVPGHEAVFVAAQPGPLPVPRMSANGDYEEVTL
jgi:hypothetical protein